MNDALFRRIDDKADEIVALTRDLVRIPTINPPGDVYRDCAELIGDRLRRRGFDVTYVRGAGTPGDSDRYPRINVVARREGGRPGPCIHFNGHIDVVQVGRGWTVDPFGGEVRDGRVYGRGTCDMKGGLAAAIVAVEALLELQPSFPGAIEVSGTADEETGGYGGVGHLARNGWFSRPRVDHVIIPEPLDPHRICLGHRGVWWAEIETLGRIAHGCMPFLGNCAVRHMGAVLERIEHALLPRLAEKRTAMPVAPEEARRSTLNVNSIHGGQAEGHEGWPSACVPDSCRMVVDRRYLIEESYDEVRAEMTALLDGLKRERAGFDYRLRELWTVPPTMTGEDQPVVRAIGAGIERVLGRRPEFVVSPGTYDQKHVVRFGHLEGCIAYGPGILDLAHQPDEWIAITDMVASAKVMGAACLALQGEAAG